MLKVSPFDFLLRWDLMFLLLELLALNIPRAEHRNAASSLLLVMVQEKNEHLSSCVEATKFFRHSVPIHKKQMKFSEMRHSKCLLANQRRN